MFGSHALLLDCFDKTNVPIIIALERIRIVLFFWVQNFDCDCY